MTDTELVDPDKERTRTRQEVETEVDEDDDEHTTTIRHYEAEVRELYCEHCNDWHHEDEMVPVGIDVEPGEEPEEITVMCQYHANSYFGYEPDADEPVYQPIVDELDHWTWREILAAVGPPVAGVVAIVMIAAFVLPAATALAEATEAVFQAFVAAPLRILGVGAEETASPFDWPFTLIATALAVMYTIKFLDPE